MLRNLGGRGDRKGPPCPFFFWGEWGSMNERKKENGKAEEARARAGLYRLVAQMVAQEPDEAFLRELNATGFRETVASLGLSPPPAPTSTEADVTCEELAVEYARLFLLPGAPLHPYESVQRGEGQLWGEATAGVQETYLEAGFELNPEVRHVPDHLAVELEFMAHLATKEAERLAAGSTEEAEALQKRQKSFLRNHLGTWAVAFAHTLKAETSQRYFQFLADLLETVIKSDAYFLDAPL